MLTIHFHLMMDITTVTHNGRLSSEEIKEIAWFRKTVLFPQVPGAGELVSFGQPGADSSECIDSTVELVTWDMANQVVNVDMETITSEDCDAKKWIQVYTDVGFELV